MRILVRCQEKVFAILKAMSKLNSHLKEIIEIVLCTLFPKLWQFPTQILNRDAFSWITNLNSVMWSMFQFIFKRQTMFVQYIKNLYNNVLQTLSLQKYVNWCVLCHYISMAFECTETCWTIWLNKSVL